jgi:hypothetical protein
MPGCVRRLRYAVGSSLDAARLPGTLLVVALLLSACGGSISARPVVCKLKAQQGIARDLSISSSSIAYARSIGTNGMPQCQFTARTAGHKVGVLVNVDNGPQAYFRLLRTVDEASQLFGPPPPGFHAPVGLSGLGPFASWFVNNHQLMATNKVELVTVSVRWPGAGRNMEVRVARAAVIPYLANPHGRGNANDYP